MPLTTVHIRKSRDRDYGGKHSFQSAKSYEENAASGQRAVVFVEAFSPSIEASLTQGYGNRE